MRVLLKLATMVAAELATIVLAGTSTIVLAGTAMMVDQLSCEFRGQLVATSGRVPLDQNFKNLPLRSCATRPKFKIRGTRPSPVDF